MAHATTREESLDCRLYLRGGRLAKWHYDIAGSEMPYCEHRVLSGMICDRTCPCRCTICRLLLRVQRSFREYDAQNPTR